MAQVSICKALLVVVLAAVLLSASAQDSEFTPAPAPTFEIGAGVRVMLSGDAVFSTLLFALAALLLQ